MNTVGLFILLAGLALVVVVIEVVLMRKRRKAREDNDAATDAAMLEAIAELDVLREKRPAYDTPDYWRMIALTKYVETQGGVPPGYEFRRIWR